MTDTEPVSEEPLLKPEEALRLAHQQLSASRQQLGDLTQQLHAMKDALTVSRAKERQLDRIFEALLDGIIVTITDGTIVRANMAAEIMFGYRVGELLGMKVEKLVPDKLRHVHIQHREGYGREPTSKRMGIRGQRLFGLRKNGTEFPLDISLSFYPTEVGVVVVSSVRDVTEWAYG